MSISDRKRLRFGIVAILIALVVGLWAHLERQSNTPQHIRITDRALQHVIERHTVTGPENAGKSTFNAGEDIRSLIRNAEHVTPVPEARGNFKRVVEVNHDIGTDRATGRQTRTYTVITTDSGELVTAFPGEP